MPKTKRKKKKLMNKKKTRKIHQKGGRMNKFFTHLFRVIFSFFISNYPVLYDKLTEIIKLLETIVNNDGTIFKYTIQYTNTSGSNSTISGPPNSSINISKHFKVF